MRKPKSKSRELRKQRKFAEQEEVSLLNEWIESQKPDSGSNTLALPPLPSNAPVGRLSDGTFSRYAGSTKFSELPMSKKTLDGLKKSDYVSMTEIQRASLPHALCGRDILGAAKTGSGKTLAFVIPVSMLLKFGNFVFSWFGLCVILFCWFGSFSIEKIHLPKIRINAIM